MLCLEETEMITFTREKPEGVELSAYLCEKAEGYLIFMLYGKDYCIPLSPEIKKVCGITRQGDRLTFKKGDSLKFGKMLQQMADAVYLQVRDTVGREITRTLSGQLNEFLENKFEDAIGDVVTDKLTQGMLPEHKEEPT